MKKLIIILSILILVACSVFAEETYVVRIKTTIESQNPGFLLKAGLNPDAFDRAVSGEEANVLGWETIEKSIKAEDVVVYFEIVQKGYARLNGEKFSLTIEASEMILGFKEDGSALEPNTTIYKTAKGRIADLAPIGDSKSIVEVSNVKSITNDTATIVAEYKGKVEDGTPIAKFTVTWPKDIDAPDGIYQASVILKVSQQ